MTGETLKSTLSSIDESLANVARKLDMSPQNLDGILRTKDIKTGLIERLATLYHKPISFFFGEDKPTVEVRASNGSAASLSGNATVSADSAKIATLEAELQYLKDKLCDKEKIISLYEMQLK